MDPQSGGPPGRFANIFINYRREDSAGHAGRLFDSLSCHFPGRLFMDVDTLAPGVDFVDAIEKAVGSCEVLLVVIGREWLTIKNAAGIRRIDDHTDFVRLEVETALARNIRVIPVLVQETPMPRPEELPPTLARLARRNAIELSDARWAYDANRLAQTIQEILGETALPPPPPSPPRRQQPPPPALVEKTTGQRSWALLLGVLISVSVVALASAGWISRRNNVPAGELTAQNAIRSAIPPSNEASAMPTDVPGGGADVQTATNPAGLQKAAVQPPPPAPVVRRQEVPKPASPPASFYPAYPAASPATAGPEEASPPPQQTAPAPAPALETPALTEISTPDSELPVEELRRLGSELEAAGARLGEIYGTFLDQKEDAGAELTASDEKLRDELEAYAEAAEDFRKRFNDGLFARTRNRLLKTDPRTELVRRFNGLAAAGGRVDSLMAEVHPSAEVRQEWQEVRRRQERVAQILR